MVERSQHSSEGENDGCVTRWSPCFCQSQTEIPMQSPPCHGRVKWRLLLRCDQDTISHITTLEKNIASPQLLVTTHFAEIIAPAQTAQLPEVSENRLLMNSSQEQKQPMKMTSVTLAAISGGSGKQQEIVIYYIIKPGWRFIYRVLQ